MAIKPFRDALFVEGVHARQKGVAFLAQTDAAFSCFLLLQGVMSRLLKIALPSF